MVLVAVRAFRYTSYLDTCLCNDRATMFIVYIIHDCYEIHLYALIRLHLHPTTRPSTTCVVSRILIASFAAFTPLAIIAPKVGPMRFEPSCSESSIPAQVVCHENQRPALKTGRKRLTGHDQPRCYLASAVDDRRFRAVHVQAAHVAELFE
jgi:hypothetical protein